MNLSTLAAMEGAGSATDITAISTELQQLLAELRSDPALSDVGKEFQRIATAMLATNAEEKKIAEQAKQTFAEIEVVRRATAEHRVRATFVATLLDFAQLRSCAGCHA